MMKKIILTLSLALLAFVSSFAGKAWPHPITIVQSNGQPITVLLNGDENFSWYTDLQGNILQRKGNDFTKLNVDPQTYIANGISKAQAKAMTRASIGTAPNLFPHVGSPRAVVILAEYQDRKFSAVNPRASFDQYLNGTDGHPVEMGLGESKNYGSVKQYFIDQSNSAYAPQFDIYGPITLPQNMAYYGGTSDSGTDEKFLQLVIDACTAMNDSLDFSQYDQDGDGNIDLVYVIYAGYGQSTGGPNETMWPKRFTGFANPKFDGKGVNQAGISNELNGFEGAFGYQTTATNPAQNFETAVKYINGTGLFIHEFSHTLGLPDFYPTTTSTPYDNQGMEDWDIMDAGTYTKQGYCPMGYTAWEREAMGWETIPVVSAEQQYQLLPEKNKRAVKIENPNNKDEYYVLELFEDKGWNQYIARYSNTKVNINYNPETKGVLIYHVDYNATDFDVIRNNVNNVIGKPKMTIIPADGRLVSSYRVNREMTPYDYAQQLNGDLFRMNNATSDSIFTQDNAALPNAAWHLAAPAIPVYNINYYWGAAYFDLKTSVATTDINKVDMTDGKPTDGKIYSIDGRYVGNSVDLLPRGIYIRNGKKFVK